ncbi:MAG: SDR family oxidoreductase [Cyanobacteria bacterium J06627_15]
MNAAIVGCGYVGTAVARHWQAQGLSVLATTTRPDRVDELSAVADSVAVLRGDELEKVRSHLADRQVVLVCVGSKRGASYGDTYLKTAQTLAQVLPESGIQQLIYTSTCSVYGQHQGAWVTEVTPAAPTTENGEIIAATEQTLLSVDTDTLSQRVCILRLGGIYGPGRTLENIYGRIAGTTRAGSGAESSNWVHLEDIVSAIDWVRQHRLGGLYNLVQDEILPARELVDKVCRQHGLAAVTWDPAQPSGRAYNARVSNAKLKATGYRFIRPSFQL